MVRLKGLEPSRPKTPDPKSGASTNSATSALADAKLVKNDETGKILCDFYDPHRPLRASAPVGADPRNGRCGFSYRPTQMSVSTDADVCIDRRGWQILIYYF